MRECQGKQYKWESHSRFFFSGQKRSFLPSYPARCQINRLGMTKTYGKTSEVLAGFSPLDTFKPIWLNLNALDHLRIHAQPIFLQEFAQPVTVD